MSKLIGIAGKLNSGKDLAGSIINELTENRYEIKKFAYNLKLIAAGILNVPVAKFEDKDFKNSMIPGIGTVRHLLQTIGEMNRSLIDKDVWVKSLFKEYKDQHWIITDVRYVNEANYIKSLGGIIIKLERENVESSTHDSESHIQEIKANYIFLNNGTINELRQALELILENEHIL